MQNIKIIFFDIDGTLVNPRTGCMSEKTKETLIRLHNNGIKLCVATGRPPASLPDLSGLPFDAFLTGNGSLCYTETETIFHRPIAPSDVKKVIANATAMGRPVSVAVRDRLAANGIDIDLADYYAVAGLILSVAEDFESVCQEDVYQIMLGCRPEDHAAIIRGVEGVSIAYSWERAVDVVPAGCSKAQAIGKVLEYFRLDSSEAIAFGDEHNDIEMLQAVGKGIAMGNAAPKVKAVAGDICAPVWDDGIYRYCLEHRLIKNETPTTI